MKKVFIMMLFLMGTVSLSAQIVVVPNKNIQYEDPRWGGEQSLEEGYAITVSVDEDNSYQWWLYPAACVVLDRSDFHIPGDLPGEQCIVIKGTNVRFREKPSTYSGILCYNTDSGASTYSIDFVNQASVKRHMHINDMAVYWDPYYLPKGTRLPYKGKEGRFYKTEFNGMTLYISKSYSYLK